MLFSFFRLLTLEEMKALETKEQENMAKREAAGILPAIGEGAAGEDGEFDDRGEGGEAFEGDEEDEGDDEEGNEGDESDEGDEGEEGFADGENEGDFASESEDEEMWGRRTEKSKDDEDFMSQYEKMMQEVTKFEIC